MLFFFSSLTIVDSNKKNKSCNSHRLGTQHKEDKVEFKLFGCLYEEIEQSISSYIGR